MSTPRLPYFDDLLEQIASAPASELVQAFGTRHVHWGYYTPAASTDTSTSGLLAAAEVLTSELIALAGIRDGDAVLDAGCGFGGTVAHMNERFGNVSLTGLNIDQRQLAHARASVQPLRERGNSVEFVSGDACQMPFSDRSFERVLAVECIFHFPSRYRFFRESRRVLKPGGRLALSDFVPFGPTLPLLALWALRSQRTVTSYFGDSNPITCTSTGYRALAQLTGFRLDTDRDITEQTLPTYPVLRRLLGARGHRAAEAATYELEKISRRGWLRYRLLSFTAV